MKRLNFHLNDIQFKNMNGQIKFMDFQIGLNFEIVRELELIPSWDSEDCKLYFRIR